MMHLVSLESTQEPRVALVLARKLHNARILVLKSVLKSNCTEKMFTILTSNETVNHLFDPNKIHQAIQILIARVATIHFIFLPEKKGFKS